MRIEVLEREKTDYIDFVRFVADGISVELANAFRRIVLSEVPTMAINEILYLENNTVLFDEILSNRIGLIPITTDLKNYNLPEECSCGGEGCSLCQAQFNCEVMVEEGQGTINIYSGHIQSIDPKIHPVNDTVLLVRAGENTSLIFDAYAQLGKGSTHAMYQPVSSIGYSYFPDITVDNSLLTEDVIDKIIELDHTKIWEKKNGKLVLKDDYWMRADLVGTAMRLAPDNAIYEGHIKDKFIFEVEGTMALPLKELLEKGCDIFLEKLEEFDEFLKKVEIFEE